MPLQRLELRLWYHTFSSFAPILGVREPNSPPQPYHIGPDSSVYPPLHYYLPSWIFPSLYPPTNAATVQLFNWTVNNFFCVSCFSSHVPPHYMCKFPHKIARPGQECPRTPRLVVDLMVEFNSGFSSWLFNPTLHLPHECSTYYHDTDKPLGRSASEFTRRSTPFPYRFLR